MEIPATYCESTSKGLVKVSVPAKYSRSSRRITYPGLGA
jgi:hypothetical protein